MTQTIREAWCWGGVLSVQGFKMLVLAYSTLNVLIWSQKLVIVRDNLCQQTKHYCSNKKYRFIFNIFFDLAGSRTDTQRVDLPAGAQMLHKLSTQQHRCVASQQSAPLQLHWQTRNIKMHTLSTLHWKSRIFDAIRKIKTLAISCKKSLCYILAGAGPKCSITSHRIRFKWLQKLVVEGLRDPFWPQGVIWRGLIVLCDIFK